MKKHYKNGEIEISISYKKEGEVKIFLNLVFKTEKEVENFLLTL